MGGKFVVAAVVVAIVSVVHAETLRGDDRLKGELSSCYGSAHSKANCLLECNKCVEQKSKSAKSPYYWCPGVKGGKSYCAKSTDLQKIQGCQYGDVLAPTSVATRNNWLANNEECKAWRANNIDTNMLATSGSSSSPLPSSSEATSDSLVSEARVDTTRASLERVARKFQCNEYPRMLVQAGTGERELNKHRKKLEAVTDMIAILCDKWERISKENKFGDVCPLLSHPFCEAIDRYRAAGTPLTDLVRSAEDVEEFIKNSESLFDANDEKDLAITKKAEEASHDGDTAEEDASHDGDTDGNTDGEDDIRPPPTPGPPTDDEETTPAEPIPALVKPVVTKTETLDSAEPLSDDAIAGMDLDLLEISENLSDKVKSYKSKEEDNSYECGSKQGSAAAYVRAVNVGLEVIRDDMKRDSAFHNVETMTKAAEQKVTSYRQEIKGILNVLRLTDYKFETAIPATQNIDTCGVASEKL